MKENSTSIGDLRLLYNKNLVHLQKWISAQIEVGNFVSWGRSLHHTYDEVKVGCRHGKDRTVATIRSITLPIVGGYSYFSQLDTPFLPDDPTALCFCCGASPYDQQRLNSSDLIGTDGTKRRY